MKIEKIIEKKFRQLKNIIPALFLSNCIEIGGEREKKFRLEFRSYLTRARKFQKRKEKNSKN